MGAGGTLSLMIEIGAATRVSLRMGGRLGCAGFAFVGNSGHSESGRESTRNQRQRKTLRVSTGGRQLWQKRAPKGFVDLLTKGVSVEPTGFSESRAILELGFWGWGWICAWVLGMDLNLAEGHRHFGSFRDSEGRRIWMLSVFALQRRRFTWADQWRVLKRERRKARRGRNREAHTRVERHTRAGEGKGAQKADTQTGEGGETKRTKRVLSL